MYLTIQEYIKRVEELSAKRTTSTDGELNGWDAKNDEILNTAITDASSSIDDSLRGRYVVPLIDIPDSIKSICCDIARAKVYSFKGILDDLVELRYKSALNQLTAYEKGLKKLNSSEVSGESSSGQIKYKKKPQKFSSEAMKGY